MFMMYKLNYNASNYYNKITSNVYNNYITLIFKKHKCNYLIEYTYILYYTAGYRLTVSHGTLSQKF